MATGARLLTATAMLAGLGLFGWAASPMMAAKTSPIIEPAHTYLSVHTGPGCAGRAAIPAFNNFLGRNVEHTVDALNQSGSWAALTSSIDWTTRCWKGSGIGLTLSVPMLVQGSNDTLRDGANGKFDAVFKQTATALVRDGHPDAIVRIGWEFNGNWQPWAASKDPQAYKDYFRRIVTLMRQTPGQRFRFEWCPNIGRNAIAPDQAYPGDDVVDIIGLDVYNDVFSKALANARTRFAYFRNEPYGLAWHRDFAAQHLKPTAFSEWGSGDKGDGTGAGDDAYFVTSMAAWFREVRPLYQSWWEMKNNGNDDTVSHGTHPQAAAAYRAAFGPGGTNAS